MSTAKVTATLRQIPCRIGRKTSSSTAYPTTAAWACPLGKLDPGSWATGWVRTGRSRCTSVLTTVFSSDDPAAVITTNSASRGNRRQSNQRTTKASTICHASADPESLISCMAPTNPVCVTAKLCKRSRAVVGPQQWRPLVLHQQQGQRTGDGNQCQCHGGQHGSGTESGC